MNRIAVLVPEYRTREEPEGGVASVADFIHHSFTRQGWDAHIISLRMWHRADISQALLRPNTWLRGPKMVNVNRNGNRITEVGSYFAELEILRYLWRPGIDALLSDYDVALSVSGSPAVALTMRGFKGIKVSQVATTIEAERAGLKQHGSLPTRLRTYINTPVVSLLDTMALRSVDLVLTENAWMTGVSNARGAKQVKMIAPGVDTNWFSPGTEETAPNAPILMVGRLAEPRKNLTRLVNAYAAARAIGVRRRLLLAGGGQLSPDVHNQMSSLGIAEHIEVVRDPSPQELRDLYRSAGLFLLTSDEEGLGIVLIEALASGLPVVATATEGAKHVVTQDVGRLVPLTADAETRLGIALAALDRDPGLRQELARAARVRAVANFSLESSGRLLVEAVQATMDGKQG